MFLYLVLKGPVLADMKAAVELFREAYKAEFRGIGYGLGLVYATKKPVSDEDRFVLGIIHWD